MNSERRERKPIWCLLYAIGALLVALIGLVDVAVPNAAVRAVLESVLVVVMFGLMAVWVRSNRVAIELQGRREPR